MVDVIMDAVLVAVVVADVFVIDPPRGRRLLDVPPPPPPPQVGVPAGDPSCLNPNRFIPRLSHPPVGLFS